MRSEGKEHDQPASSGASPVEFGAFSGFAPRLLDCFPQDPLYYKMTDR